MIAPGSGVRVYLACGVTDMRKGIAGLSALVQEVLWQNPASGAVFIFRGRRGDRIKLLFWDGQGFCLFYKVLERGRFPWPSPGSGLRPARGQALADGTARLTTAQLAMLWGDDRSAQPIERSSGPFKGRNARSASAGPAGSTGAVRPGPRRHVAWRNRCDSKAISLFPAGQIR